MQKYLKFSVPVVILTAVMVITIARGGDTFRFIKPDPGFRDWISAYSSGVVSVATPIRIRLAEPYADSLMIGRQGDASLFSFSPSVSGEVVWVDSRTVEFRPAEPMQGGTGYTCTFHLGSLKRVPDEFQRFVFNFHTIRQSYEVRLDPLVIPEDQPDMYRLTGRVLTADVTSDDLVRQVLSAVMVTGRVRRDVAVRWVDRGSSTGFAFVVDSLPRGETSAELVLSHRGRSLGVRGQGEERIVLPGKGEFRVLDVSVQHDPDASLVVTFSDLLDPSQEFDGMVRLGQLRNLRFMVDGNRLHVYPPRNRTGEFTLIVEPVLSISGIRLGQAFTRTVDFEESKPAVRFVGEGTIMPSTNGLLFPFEAVHLKALDVQIQKIYERNIPQFLQVNELGGSGEMYRVATTVFHDKVDLSQLSNSVADFGQWNRYALDLTTLISPERGALYRVILSFKRAYSTWPCGGGVQEAEDLTPVDRNGGLIPGDTWSFLGDNEDEWYYYEDYEWSERNNPCHNSYYYYRSVSRNILSSDLGLIAKAGSDGELICFVTDIVTAMPLRDIEVELLDMQMQVLSSGRSDADGRVTFSPDRTPFLVIARRGDERGYLKLGDANTLSMSLFDVDGRSVRGGIKGFLYAERGVWRPGDTMFIHFILEDKLNVLPDNVPVMFELSDPQGNIVQRKVSTSSVKGIYAFHTHTLETAVTGNYLGRIYLGNLTFARYFKVETIKPNRLRISLQFPGDVIDASGGAGGVLEARWLHGAKAPDLRADVSMVLQSGRTSFRGYSGYVFDDPTVELQTESTTIFDGRLDREGKATVNPSLESVQAPGVLSASFTTRVFEPGGDFSINTVTVPYYPYGSYAGLWTPAGEGWYDMLSTGTQHQFRVANVTHTGAALSGRRLRVQVYRIDWRWWWHNSSRGLPYFLSNTEASPVYTAEIPVSNGRGRFTWGAGTSEWGRYLIRVTDLQSGHSTGKVVYMDHPGWGRRPGQMRDGASMLSVSTDKEKYQVGDKATVIIPSAPEGRALVSIESGTRVLRTEWIRTDSGTTRIPLDITPEMAPNVYVHITVLQPHSQTFNDMPIRMYGVVPVVVEDPATRLLPVLEMAEVWEAEQEVTIRVREQSGRPMAYTLALVDEGLLDLTGFRTPDPWSHFYGKEALGVRTWDLFQEVIGAWAGGFDRMISIGGGDTRIDHDKQRQRRFPPVVRCLGPLYLEAGRTATHKIRLPQYVGSLRVMVVAAHEGSYGHAEKTAAVRSPLMVLGTLPRVAGPGETIEVPVSVFAMDEQVRNVQVTITPGGLFEAAGAVTRSITFQRTGDQVVNFTLKVKNQTGTASVDIVAVSGNRTARQTIHLDVRNPVTTQVRWVEATVAPGQTWDEEVEMHGIAGTNSASVELSSVPPLNLSERLDYLIRYPHGCLEQILSAAFPQLILRDLIPLDQRSSQEVDRNIRDAINRLHQFFNPDGVFSYWPGTGYHNEWANSYAGHFMIEAEMRGYALPHGYKQRWITAQKRLAGLWSPEPATARNDLTQAYRLYTLALAGAPDLGAMNRLRSFPRLSVQARWRLAAAYAVAGRMKTARQMVEDGQVSFPAYTEYGNTFGNTIRDKAMVLEAAVLLNRESLAASLARELATVLNGRGWLNTQTTAYALISMGRFYARTDVAEGIDCQLEVNGTSKRVQGATPFHLEELEGVSHARKRRIKVTNRSRGTLYVKVRVAGTPLPGEEIPSANRLKMDITYQLPDGTRIDPARIQQGTDFIARVTITNTTPDFIREIALTHMVPSGWQIHNPRMAGPQALSEQGNTQRQQEITYQDFRDDRVLTYFNLRPNRSVTVHVMLNATYAGKFYLPPLRCEAMYNAETFAQGAGRWIEVVR